MTEWRRQRDLYRTKQGLSKLTRGFAAFYLNRCNRSGIIIDGGPIGGVRQTGKWKLGARFNRADLKRRCEKVAEYRDRIQISHMDGVEFIESRDADKTFFFIDPPYFGKGETLYLNKLTEDYHQSLGVRLKTMSDKAWILTYDDCPEIRKIYKGWATIRPFSLRYAAAERRSGKEIMIAPKWMRLPISQNSEAIEW